MLQLKLKLEKKKQSNSKISSFCHPQKPAHEGHTLMSESLDFDDETSMLKEKNDEENEDKLENLAALLNENTTELSHNRFLRQNEKIDKKNLDTEFDMFLDGLILDDTRSKDTPNSQSAKPFSLSPRRPWKNHEKSNFSRFFQHRNSSPTLNPTTTSSTNSTISTPQIMNDFLTLQPTNSIDNKQKSSNCNSIFMAEYRNKYRENIRRNRSFKLIESDLIIEENEAPPNRVLSAGATSSSSNSENRLPHNRNKLKLRPNASSVQDLLEHLNLNKRPEMSCNGSDASLPNGQYQNSSKLNKRWNPPPKLYPTSGFENKLFIDKEHTYPAMMGGGGIGSLNAGSSTNVCDHKNRTTDISTDSDNFENSFRFLKMTSDSEYNLFVFISTHNIHRYIYLYYL